MATTHQGRREGRRDACERDWFGCERKLPPGFPTLGKLGTVVFWVIIAVIVVMIARTEVRHLRCYTDTCNSCISPDYRSYPMPGDDNVTLLARIENGTRVREEGVRWRRSVLIAVFLAALIPLLVMRRFPDPVSFLLAFVIVFVVVYMVGSWYDMHIDFRVQENITRSIQQLRVNLGYMKESTACGVYGPIETKGFDHKRCSQ